MDDRVLSGRERASFAEQADVDEFVATLEKFERGEISAEAWRKFRLVRGTYGQRQDDVQMLRVKIPQGVLTALQVESLADVAERYARGFAHVTTRQNIQFHFLKLADVETVMRRMADEGITTREACGNSVRNITACPFAGVAADEVFDVTPYAEALTRYFLRHPLSAVLPRKFKIAFEGCPEDHALASINDLGWTARIEIRDGRDVRGFRLTVGGGTSILPVSGRVLFEFLPASEMLNVAEAIVRVYHRLGDHEHRQRNRMKFLIKTLGWDRWRDEVTVGARDVPRGGRRRAAVRPGCAACRSAARLADRRTPVARGRARAGGGDDGERSGYHAGGRRDRSADAAAFEAWSATNVASAAAGRAIAPSSSGSRWATSRRGNCARWRQSRARLATARSGSRPIRISRCGGCRSALVRDLFERLAAAGLAAARRVDDRRRHQLPGRRVVQAGGHAVARSGPGAERHARRAPRSRAGAAAGVIKISGCPNGCGQHHIATLGFQGSVRKVDGRAVPQYFVMVGGSATAEGATFAPPRRQSARASRGDGRRAPARLVSPRSQRPTNPRKASSHG